MNFRTNTGLAGVAIALCLGFASPADAVTRERWVVQNPTGACDALIPSSDPDLRRQPAAIKNISPTNTNVVVSCSLYGDNNAADPTQVYVYFTNQSTVNRTVNCTLYAGGLFSGITTINRSFVLAPGAMNLHSWVASDLPDGVKKMNLSCVLAKGVVMHDLATKINEDVGA